MDINPSIHPSIMSEIMTHENTDKTKFSAYIPDKVHGLFIVLQIPSACRLSSLYILGICTGSKQGTYFAAHKTTARKLGLSVSTIRRTLALLQNMKIVKRVVRNTNIREDAWSDIIDGIGHTRAYKLTKEFHKAWKLMHERVINGVVFDNMEEAVEKLETCEYLPGFKPKQESKEEAQKPKQKIIINTKSGKETKKISFHTRPDSYYFDKIKKAQEDKAAAKKVK